MFFRDRNKHIREKPQLTRIVPAQQNLSTNTLLAARIKQRLTEQFELMLRQAQIDFAGSSSGKRSPARRCSPPVNLAAPPAESCWKIVPCQRRSPRTINVNGKGKRCEETERVFIVFRLRKGIYQPITIEQMPFVHRQAGATDLRQLWLQGALPS